MLEKGSCQRLPVGLDKISPACSVLSSRDNQGKWQGVIFAAQPLFCIGICMTDINTLCACKSEIAACWAFAREKGFDFAAFFHCWSKSLNLSSSSWLLNYPCLLLYVIGEFCSILLSLLRVGVDRGILNDQFSSASGSSDSLISQLSFSHVS